MKPVVELWVLLLYISFLKGEFYLNILERVTEYGQTAKLLCVIGYRFKTPVGFWDIFIPEPTLAFAVVKNETQRNDTKYFGIFVENGFTLEIRNLSNTDLNISYMCSVGNNASTPKLLVEANMFEGNLHLVLLEKVETYGNTLKLLCKSESCNNVSCHWRYGWRKGVHENEFLKEDVPWLNMGTKSKYHSQLVLDGFTLEIRNVSMTDLNIKYECYLPFNRSELLNLTVADVFKEHPIPTKGKNNGLSTGAITAITIGMIVFITALLVLFLKRKHMCFPDLVSDNQTDLKPSDDLPGEQETLVDHGIELGQREERIDRTRNPSDPKIEIKPANEKPEEIYSHSEKPTEDGSTSKLRVLSDGSVNKYIIQCGKVKAEFDFSKVTINGKHSKNKLTATFEYSPEFEAEMSDFIANVTNKNMNQQDCVFYIKFAEKKCIVLHLEATPNVFESEDTFDMALERLLQDIVEAGHINTSIPFTIRIDMQTVIEENNGSESEPDIVPSGEQFGPATTDIQVDAITEHEKTRCAKQSWIVVDVFNCMMRDLANCFIKPDVMHRQLVKLYEFLEYDAKDILNNLLDYGYNKFDTELICKLLVHSQCLKSPSNGWNNAPADSNQTLSDDIQRMRLARNALLCRLNTRMPEKGHTRFFKTFKKVGERFDGYLRKETGKSFKTEIEKIEICKLNISEEDMYIEKARTIENMKLHNTEVYKNRTINLHYGNSARQAINNLKWKDYTERRLVLFISTSDIEVDFELFGAVRKFKEDLNKGNKFIQIIKTEWERIIVTVHPFALQSIKYFASEVVKILQNLIDMTGLWVFRKLDVAVSHDLEMTNEEEFLWSFDKDEGKSSMSYIQYSFDDLVLTTEIKETTYSSEHDLCKAVHSVVTEATAFEGDNMIISKCFTGTSKQDMSRGQAQFPVFHNLPISAHFKQSITIPCKYVGDCIVVNKTVVLTDNTTEQLTIVNRGDGDIHQIPVTDIAWSATMIDDTTVGVSFPFDNVIKMINIQTGNIKDTIEIGDIGWGSALSFYNGNLYLNTETQKTHVMDLRGNILRTLPTGDDITAITVDRNRIYYTAIQTFYCCDLYGKTMWSLEHGVIKNLCGVTVDAEGNVYICGYSTKKILVVSPDGKHHKEIISESSGLDDAPGAIYFDKMTSELLVFFPQKIYFFDIHKQTQYVP